MALIFSKCTAASINSLARESTIFFFPVGPIEDHGPHLPIVLDILEAEAVAVKTAEQIEKVQPGWTSVVMPALPLGIDSNTTHLSISVRPHVLRDWLVDSCRHLSRLGFKYFVCFSGHLGPKQLTAIEDASRLLRGTLMLRWIKKAMGKTSPVLISASSALVDRKTVKASPTWPDPEEHGGERDTSIALAISPELVSENYLELKEQRKNRSKSSRLWQRCRGKLSGYWGVPASAKRDLGIKLLSDQVDFVTPKILSVLSGSNPERLFRSWYSLIPSNKSFFRGWLLFAALSFLIFLWFFVVLRYLF